VVVRNKKDKEVLINEVGWAGIQLGRLNFQFKKESNKNW
jgi:5'-nucleotidase